MRADPPVARDNITVRPEARPSVRDDGSGSTEDRLAAMEQKLSVLERRGNTAQALVEYAKTLGSADGGTAGPASPTFELAVRSLYDQIQWERQEQERAEQDNRRAERADELVTTLKDKLGLSANQQAQVRTVLVGAMDAVRDLRSPPEGAERPRGPTQWRERMRAIHEEADGRLAQILTTQQLDLYKELRESDEQLRILRPWGGRGRPGGGP
jgi:hypothetical protein